LRRTVASFLHGDFDFCLSLAYGAWLPQAS